MQEHYVCVGYQSLILSLLQNVVLLGPCGVYILSVMALS